MHWLFHYFKNIFLLYGKFFFPSPSYYSQACFQSSGAFLPVCAALYSLGTCLHVLAEVTDSLWTARSRGALPRPRLTFSGTSGVPVSSLLVKWASLSPSFLPAPRLLLNIGTISPGLCPRLASLPVLRLSSEQTCLPLPSCLILLCQGFSGLLPARTFSPEIQSHVSGSLLDTSALLSQHCLKKTL